MRRSSLVLGVLLAAACGESSEDDGLLRIEDQSGAEFFWDAEEEDVHRIVAVSPPLPECTSEDDRPRYTYGLGRFLRVYAVCWGDGSGVSWSDWHRYLICEDDEDCPQSRRSNPDMLYECRAGFCQNVDLEAHPPGLPNSIDMEMLCRGDAPRYEVDKHASDPALDLRVDAACPDHRHEPYAACTSVPDGCFDPR